MTVLAERVMKARKVSVLSCGCLVITGHMIACVRGHWVCMECFLAAREGEPMPVYDAMIKRSEGGPDPLVPEPLGIPKAAGKAGKPAKTAGKPAKAAKKGE